MTRLSFHEVTRIEGIAVATNDLLAKYAHKLDRSLGKLPMQVQEAHAFRMKVEHVSGALIDIARLRAAELFSNNSDDAVEVLRKLDSDKEINQILEAVVSLNGHQGLGHATVKEIAKLVSRQPKVISLAKAKLEKKINALVEKCYSEGSNVMDIIRHVHAPQRQCMFAV